MKKLPFQSFIANKRSLSAGRPVPALVPIHRRPTHRARRHGVTHSLATGCPPTVTDLDNSPRTTLGKEGARMSEIVWFLNVNKQFSRSCRQSNTVSNQPTKKVSLISLANLKTGTKKAEVALRCDPGGRCEIHKAGLGWSSDERCGGRHSACVEPMGSDFVRIREAIHRNGFRCVCQPTHQNFPHNYQEKLVSCSALGPNSKAGFLPPLTQDVPLFCLHLLTLFSYRCVSTKLLSES